jgi:hypothetical protein
MTTDDAQPVYHERALVVGDVTFRPVGTPAEAEDEVAPKSRKGASEKPKKTGKAKA